MLFCTYYCLSRNAREAAAKSGYIFPEKNAVRLLKKESVISEIERIDREKRNTQKDIMSGYYRLAFGCVADAIGLLFREEVDLQQLQSMDLYNISDIKKKKGGDIEIKFFDRLKALERLQEISCCDGKDSAGAIYEAIEKSAAALRNGENE